MSDYSAEITAGNFADYFPMGYVAAQSKFLTGDDSDAVVIARIAAWCDVRGHIVSPAVCREVCWEILNATQGDDE